MNKVGFVVGHPTQFEGPFFKFVSELEPVHSLTVYFYSYKDGIIIDQDMKASSRRNWGIDILSGYSWKYSIRQIQETLNARCY